MLCYYWKRAHFNLFVRAHRKSLTFFREIFFSFASDFFFRATNKKKWCWNSNPILVLHILLRVKWGKIMKRFKSEKFMRNRSEYPPFKIITFFGGCRNNTMRILLWSFLVYIKIYIWTYISAYTRVKIFF